MTEYNNIHTAINQHTTATPPVRQTKKEVRLKMMPENLKFGEEKS